MKYTRSVTGFFFYLFFTCALLTSCNSVVFDENYFFLENKGAIMPIWVRGNIESGKFIMHLHGGPGGTSIYFGTNKTFEILEKDFAVVYWDQRGAGTSDGNTPHATLTINQCVDDLDLIINLLITEYNVSDLFLMGHSWGGALGTSYLINKRLPLELRGWIEIDGANNYPLANRLSREWMMTKCQTMLDKGDNSEDWQEILDWYIINPVLSLATKQQHASYVSKANGYRYSNEYNPFSFAVDGKTIFSTPFGIFQLLWNNYFSDKYFEDLQALNLFSEMKQITIPALILWGEHDGKIPQALAYEAYNHIGTNSSQKELYIFNETAHSPHIEENILFSKRVKDFVMKYSN